MPRGDFENSLFKQSYSSKLMVLMKKMQEMRVMQVMQVMQVDLSIWWAMYKSNGVYLRQTRIHIKPA